MTLYHYTNHVWLVRILREGISRGDVPTSPTEGFNGVWLSSSGNAKSQGWTDGTDGKQSVRLTVEIEASDTLLKAWKEVCREHRISGRWRKVLNERGGYGEIHWFVYHGTIPPEIITAIDILQEPTAAEKEFMRADSEGRLERVPDDIVARKNGVPIEVARNIATFRIRP